MLPPLRSVSIFDGTPPQEEGEDPKLFHYWPKATVSKDAQLNEIGLYLTFLGFCKDFRASSDCQYFETDSLFTCFAHLYGTVYAAAAFDVSKPNVMKSPRILQTLMHTFAALYVMVKDFQDFTSDRIEDLQKIFTQFPFLSKAFPVRDVWMLCEEALADSMQIVKNLRGGAFFFDGMLLHTSIDPADVAVIYLAHKAKITTFYQGDYSSGDEVVWVLGSFSNNHCQPPKVQLSDGPAHLVMLAQGRLTMLMVFSEPHVMNPGEFKPVRDTLDPFAGSLLRACQKLRPPEVVGAEVLRVEGQFEMARPLTSQGLKGSAKFFDWKRTDCYVKLITEQKLSFTRAVMQVGAPPRWLFMEQFGDQAALVARSPGTSVTLPDAVRHCLDELKDKVVC
jgi:hypothetical protein